jgi:hypothetical protein
VGVPVGGHSVFLGGGGGGGVAGHATSMTDATLDTILHGIRFRRDVLALPLEQVVVNYETERDDNVPAHAQGIASPGHEVISLHEYDASARPRCPGCVSGADRMAEGWWWWSRVRVCAGGGGN